MFRRIGWTTAGLTASTWTGICLYTTPKSTNPNWSELQKDKIFRMGLSGIMAGLVIPFNMRISRIINLGPYFLLKENPLRLSLYATQAKSVVSVHAGLKNINGFVYRNHIIVPCGERFNGSVKCHLVDRSEWTGTSVAKLSKEGLTFLMIESISTDLVKTTPKFDIEHNSLKMCKYPLVKDQSIMSMVYDIATENTYILDGLDAGPGGLVIDESGHFIGIIGHDGQVIGAEIINSLYHRIDKSMV